jgi:hypothetical protein
MLRSYLIKKDTIANKKNQLIAHIPQLSRKKNHMTPLTTPLELGGAEYGL